MYDPCGITPNENTHVASQLQGEAASTRPAVLIIDDCRLVRHMVQCTVNKMGYDVTEATNGQEGLEAMKTKLFAHVFCDVDMELMDGLECVRTLRQWELGGSQEAQVIHCVTGSEMDVNRVNFEDLGFSSFMTKPYTRAKMESLLLR